MLLNWRDVKSNWKVSLALGLMAFVLMGGSASAQSLVEQQGYRLGGTLHSDLDGVLGMDANPASIGFLKRIQGGFAYTRESGQEMGSLLVGGRMFGPFAAGVSGHVGNEAVGRLGGVFAAGSESFSMGFQVRGLIRGDNGRDNDSPALDLGFTSRPSWWASFAATLHDANAPLVDGERYGEKAGFDLSIRPGWERITLGFGARVPVARPEEWSPVFNLNSQLADGFSLGLSASPGDENDPENTESQGWDLAAFLGLDFNRLGAVYVDGGLEGVGSSDGPEPGGFGAAVLFTDEDRGRLTRPSSRWAKISLGRLGERPATSLFGGRGRTFLGLARYMRALGQDEKLEGVVLALRGYQGSWAQAQELRALIGELQSAGKKVACVITETNTLGYFVASQADTVIVDPAGGVWLVGVSSSVLFYRDLLEQVGVDAQAIRVGRYKSFPESFTRMSPSEDLNLVKETLTEGIYQEIVTGISDARAVAPEQVSTWMEEGPYVASELKERGIVDVVAHADEVRKKLEEIQGNPVRIVSRYRPYSTRADEWGSRDKVAVLAITGTIVSGGSSSAPLIGYQSGERTVSKILDALSKDERVKGVVLRIDSPGGSALASDQLFRKVRKLARKKPVVVSMGGVAASGGYFIAAAADHIIAEPTTVTGSIGIFTTKFSFAELFDFLGVRQSIWKRGKNADIFASSKSWTPEQEELIQGKLAYFYERFLKAVASGRDMERDAVHELAQGRVWLGKDAKANGLVDELGGLQDAIDEVIQRAGITREVEVVHLPRVSWKEALKQAFSLGLPGVFASELDVEEKELTMEDWLAALGSPLEALGNLAGFGAGEPLALLPFTFQQTGHHGLNTLE